MHSQIEVVRLSHSRVHHKGTIELRQWCVLGPVRPDLLDVLLLELAQLQNRPGWPVKKKKVDKAVIF